MSVPPRLERTRTSLRRIDSGKSGTYSPDAKLLPRRSHSPFHSLAVKVPGPKSTDKLSPMLCAVDVEDLAQVVVWPPPRHKLLNLCRNPKHTSVRKIALHSGPRAPGKLVGSDSQIFTRNPEHTSAPLKNVLSESRIFPQRVDNLPKQSACAGIQSTPPCE